MGCLQEKMQKDGLPLPEYTPGGEGLRKKLIEPNENIIFFTNYIVHIQNFSLEYILGVAPFSCQVYLSHIQQRVDGTGSNKKEAKNSAAKNMIRVLHQLQNV